MVRRWKYPRTLHLPGSPGVGDDDKVLESVSGFVGEDVVVTIKMDGENSSIYSDYSHARSVDGRSDSSRSYVKCLQGRVSGVLPVGYRLCAENLRVVHSIKYDDLEDYVQVFSVWDEDLCLSWSDTVEWCELLGVTMVPVLYAGVMLPVEELEGLFYDYCDEFGGQEGFVVRKSDSFLFGEFSDNVVKWVRAGHNQCGDNWRNNVQYNELRGL